MKLQFAFSVLLWMQFNGFAEGATQSDDSQIDLKTLVQIYNVNYKDSNAVYFMISSQINRKILTKFFSQVEIFPMYMFNEKFSIKARAPTAHNSPMLLDKNVNVFCIGTNITEIVPIVKVQLQPLVFNHRSNFTIAIINMQLNASELSDVVLTHFFMEFIQTNIFNVALYVRGVDFERILTFNYFLDELIDLTAGPIDQLFSDKISNFYGKPLRVSLVQQEPVAVKYRTFEGFRGWSGEDGGAVQPLADYLNATLEIVQDGLDGLESGMKSQSGQQHLTKKSVDVVLNSRLIIPTKNIEFLHPYYYEPIMAVTPKSQLMHGSTAFIATFDYTLRNVVFGTTLVLILLTTLVRKLTKMKDASLSAGLIQTICSSICSSVASVPTTDAGRIFMVSCAFYHYLIISAFTSTLTSKFIVPQYMEDINNLRQLTDSHLPLLTRTDLEDIFSFIEKYESDDPVWNFLRQNMQLANISYVNEEVSKNNVRFCYLNLRSRGMEIVDYKQFSNKGRPTFHLMEEILLPAFASWTVQWGSPFSEYLNRFTKIARETGLTIKWASGVGFWRPEKTDRVGPEPITFARMTFAFIFIGVGLMLGILILVCEIVKFKYHDVLKVRN